MRTHFLFGGFGPFRLLPGPACLPPPSWLAVTWLRTAHSTAGTALDLSGSLNPGPVQPEPQGRGVSPFPPPWFFASACPGLDFTRRTSVGSSAPVGEPTPQHRQWDCLLLRSEPSATAFQEPACFRSSLGRFGQFARIPNPLLSLPT